MLSEREGETGAGACACEEATAQGGRGGYGKVRAGRLKAVRGCVLALG